MNEGVAPEVILEDCLTPGMSIIGEKFTNCDVFVPEVLVAARAMNAGLSVLGEQYAVKGINPIGKAMIGTVKGDLHDLGKNIVVIMLKAVGFEVLDLGVDVSPETFFEKAVETNPQIICMSALLTTTMEQMKDCIDLFYERDLKNKYLFMVGGAPVNQNFAIQIHADLYADDATKAAQIAKKAVMNL